MGSEYKVKSVSLLIGLVRNVSGTCIDMISFIEKEEGGSISNFNKLLSEGGSAHAPSVCFPKGMMQVEITSN